MSVQDRPQDPPVPIRIYDSSPSEHGYPAANVLQGDPLSVGWRTVADITFPLFLAVELDGLYEVSSVQFVAHETYVPAEVELFTSAAVPPQEWVRLGSVRMGTAAQHRARERKTFRFSIQARVVKFVFTDYLAVEKATGQISLTSVVVRGKRAPGIQHAAPAEQPAQQLAGHLSEQMVRKAQEVAQYVHIIEERKAALDELIQGCVDRDEYLLADRYLVTVQKLDGLKAMLEQLQIKKLSAIKQQNYKAAQQIKMSQDQIFKVLAKDLDDMVALMNGDTKKEAEERQRQRLQEEEKDELIQTLKKQPPQRRAEEAQREEPAAQKSQAAANPADEQPIPTRRSQRPPDLNDPNFDPSQLRGKNFFQATEEEERQFQELINRKMRQQQQTEAEQQAEREKAAASRPESFRHDLTDQEYANFVIDGTKFPDEPFNYARYSKLLAEGWEKDDNKPDELTSHQRCNEDVGRLLADGVEDMIIRLLVNKALDKVREAMRFFDAALKDDYKRVDMVMHAVRVVANYQQNQAMLYICQWLMLRCYLALIQKYTERQYEPEFRLRLRFLDVADQIARQKENSVVLARFEVVAAKPLGGDLDEVLKALVHKTGHSMVDFYNDVLFIANPLITRLHSNLRPARVVALNVLGTLASFPLFGAKNFFNQLLTFKAIDRYTRNTDADALVRDQRYQLVVEQRCMAARGFLENAPWLLEGPGFEPVAAFVDQLLAHCNRTETKRAVIFLLRRLYDCPGSDGVLRVVRMVNSRVSGATLMRQLCSELLQVDLANGMPGQVRFVEGSKGDKNDVPRIVVINPALDGRLDEPVSADFPPGVCQFCCRELTKDLRLAERLVWEHLAVECPCCCVCPACRQAVELVYIGQHLASASECPGLRDYQYEIRQCAKCRLGFEAAALAAHEAQCDCTLAGDEMLCPLCGELLADGEQALIHYGDAKCQANPRTAPQFIEIVQQKVQKGQ